jgi:small nuclear ribonucleoprotein (snRNP)-like protein
MSLPSSGDGGGGKRKRDSSNSSSGGGGGGGGGNNNNNNAKQKSGGGANNIDTSKTTLSSLLKYMEGYEIIVELKTGIRHRGRLTSADDNMNLTLEEEEDEEDDDDDQEHNNNNEKKKECSKQNPVVVNIERNIRGSNIRYIHFPDNANLSSVFQSGREREKNASQKYQKTKRKSS